MPRRPSLSSFRLRQERWEPWQPLQPDRDPVPRGQAAWVLPAVLAAALVLALALAALRQRQEAAPGVLDVLSRHAGWAHLTLTALVAGTFLCFYWPRRRQVRSFSLVAGSALGVVAVVLGLASYLPCNGTQAPVFAPVTWTVGLFFGNQHDVWTRGSCAGARPVAVSVAYLSALLATTVGFGAVLATATRDQWDRLQVRLARSVVVVAGLDDVTLPVVRALRGKAPRDTLVVIDPDATHPGARQARAAGARVVTGELADAATARSVLLRGSHLKARAVYLVSPDRTVNLERLSTLVTHLSDNSGPGPRPDGVLSRAVVRVDDPWQVEDHRRTALDARYRPWLLEAVSIYETTARAVVDRLTAADCQRLLVAGSTPLTLAMLGDLARREREAASAETLGIPAAVVGPPLPSRVVVLARDADELLRDHVEQQARFGNQAASAPEAVLAEASCSRIAGIVVDDAWHVVVTSPPSPESALLAARVTARHPKCTVEFLAESAARSTVALSHQRPRPVALTLIQPDGRLSDDTWEYVARLVHERHRLSFADSAGQDAPSRRPWEELPPFYRESGLRQIRKVLEAVAAEGRSWGPVTDSGGDIPLTEAELERISAAEHRSWFDYYRQNGWRPLQPEQTPRVGSKRHPMLRPWKALSKESQQRTYRGVERTIRLLRALGYRPVVAREDARAR